MPTRGSHNFLCDNDLQCHIVLENRKFYMIRYLCVVERYKEMVVNGTRFGDDGSKCITYHQKFNWMCAVVRNLIRTGGCSNIVLRRFVMVNIEQLRKMR